jgi:hypothetical protein
MTLLAGYDLVLEMTKDTLLRHIKGQAKFASSALAPPFDLTIDWPARSFSSPTELIQLPAGVLYLRANTIDIALVPGTFTVGVNIGFSSGAIAAGSLQVGGLDGYFVTWANLTIVDDPAPLAAIAGYVLKSASLDFRTSTTELHLSRQGQTNLESGISESHATVTAAELENEIQSQLGAMARSGQPPLIPQPGFPTRSAGDGSLGDPTAAYQGPVLRSVDAIQCVTPDVVAIFATLLTDSVGGSPTSKTATAVVPGNDVALIISSESFRRLKLCPGLIQKMRPELANAHEAELRQQAAVLLPSLCGSASGIDYKNVTITRLWSSMVDGSPDGHINFDGAFSKEGTCYAAYGSFHSELHPQIVNGQFETQSSAPTHSVDIHVPWYCDLALYVVAVFFEPAAAALGGVFGNITDGLFGLVGDALAPSPTTPKPKTTGFQGLKSVTFNQVATRAEGLIIGGRWEVEVPAGVSRSLEIVGSVEPDGIPVFGLEKQYTTHAGPICPSRTFPYREWTQQLKGDFELLLDGWVEPVSIAWTLEQYRGFIGWDSAPTLTSSATLDPTPATQWANLRADSRFDAPPPQGPTLWDNPLALMYEGTDRSVTLHNNPSQGSYGLTLHARVTDAAGVSMDAFSTVAFKGEGVDIYGGYDDFMRACAIASRIYISKFRVRPAAVPRDGDPGGLATLIDALMDSPSKDANLAAEGLFEYALIRYGDDFSRALTRIRTGLPGMPQTPASLGPSGAQKT